MRTGYEQVIAQRTSDMFATAAKQDGVVTSVTTKGIIVQYKDGSTHGVELGRRFGAAAGLTIPHELTSDFKIGDEFKAGQVLAYNQGFFEKDILNPNNVVWKSGVLTKVALYESNQTLEDASSISKKLAEKLTTTTTKVKTVIVSFKHNLRSVLEVGKEVQPSDVLCMIEDDITSNSNLFDEESLDTLKMLGSQAPTAKVKGVIERIEVLYNGDKEDMSETLRSLTNTSDREISKRQRSQGKPSFTGSVTDDLRIENEPLSLDTAAIRFYITSSVPAGIGD